MEYLIIIYYYLSVGTSTPIFIPNQYTGLYIEAMLNSKLNWYKCDNNKLKKKTSC